MAADKLNIAMLYASWTKFGEPWCTPDGIRSELESRGHDVVHYNLYHDDGRLFPDGMRHYSNQGINNLLRDFRQGRKLDAIFVLDYGPWDALQFDKQYFPGVVLLKECGDEPQAHRQHFQASPRVHVMLSPDRQCVERYQSFGYNGVYWTHHADTRIFYPRPDVHVEFDCVTTCGSRGGGLTEAIKKSLGDSFNNERYFYGVDHAVRLNKGKMVFQCSQFKEVTRRIFEGMACGRMVITDRLPPETGLEEMFVDGQDIVYYDNAQDAIEKIRYYASHDEEREAIAKSGYEKVMREHTQVQRCDVLEACVVAAQETLV
jgi:glycosyltransferase involved in cell wall biosynthesis